MALSAELLHDITHSLLRCAARTVCGMLVLLLRPLLGGLPRLIDSAFAGSPRAELAVTMVLFPLALNLVQAWIQDTHLKHAPRDGTPPRHGRSGSRSSVAGGSFGGLEAVREERTSLDGGARPDAKAASDCVDGGEDREALLSPYRCDS
jgi:hypothetical protein